MKSRSMNYNKVYNLLIERALTRINNADVYYEKHHIIPRCIGGTDFESNLVALTAREHFIAHLCLIRIYPGNNSLIKAAIMMACFNGSQPRSGNRIYEWLRKKHRVAMSDSQTGEKNSQFGSKWIFNATLKENKKVNISDIKSYTDIGWEEGRVINFNNIYKICEVCNSNFRSNSPKVKTCSKSCNSIMVGKFKSFLGRENELKSYYAQTKSMNKALKLMGFPGAISHYYHWAKFVLTA